MAHVSFVYANPWVDCKFMKEKEVECPTLKRSFMNTGPTKTWGCFDLRRECEARVSLALMLMSSSSLVDSCEILMHYKGLSSKFLAFVIHRSSNGRILLKLGILAKKYNRFSNMYSLKFKYFINTCF